MRAKATWVVMFFTAATLLSGYVLELALSDIFNFFRISNLPLLGERFTLSSLVAFTVAIVAGVYCGGISKRIRGLVEQCVVELEKTAWPSGDDTKKSTATVVLASFIAAFILGIFDTCFAWLTAQNLFMQ